MTACKKCNEPGGHADGLCIRCKAIELEEKCAKCGSPWIYIHAFMSEKKPRVPLCKPCCYAYIKLSGYADDLNVLLAKMREEWEAEKEAALKPAYVEPEAPEILEDGQEVLTFHGQ